MGQKPSVVPTWDTNNTNVTVTPGSEQTDGWAVNQIPPSGIFNYWMNASYQWDLFSSIFFTSGGGATGTADLGAIAETTVTPTWIARDFQGHPRSLIDHNGFRAGQVSEIDEHWKSSQTTISLPPLGVATGSTSAWDRGTGSHVLGASDALEIALGDYVPAGAIITSISVYLAANAFANTPAITATLYTGDPLSGGVTSVAVSRTFTVASLGAASNFDVMITPTTGTGPMLVKNTQTMLLQIARDATANTNNILGIKVIYRSMPVGWSFTGATTGLVAVCDTFSFQDPLSITAGGNQRMVTVQTAAGASTAGDAKLLSTIDTGFDADLLYSQECLVVTGTIDDSSHAALFNLGVLWGNNDFACAQYVNGVSDWRLRFTDDITSVNIATGIAVVANTAYRMRLEIRGVNRNTSGSTKVLLYINGALVASATGTVVASGANLMQALFEAKTAGTVGGGYSFSLGRVRRVWSHLASPDLL